MMTLQTVVLLLVDELKVDAAFTALHHQHVYHVVVKQ